MSRQQAPGTPRRPLPPEALALYERTGRVVDVARAFGFDPDTVSRQLRRLGLRGAGNQGKPLADDDVRARILSCRADGCWPWRYARSPRGYGRQQFRGRVVNAHRVAFELFVRAIPPGKVVLHACDNPPCVNPDHLSIGTQAQNITDCVNKVRHSRGESNGNNVLVEDDVRVIRALRDQGFAIAAIHRERFPCVSYGAVADAARFETWRHVR